jgi:hypothetical protein
MNIISLGAGVQSSTLALMAAKDLITPMPDAAIFADTGWEPRKVHKYLDWLEKQLPFPVYRVMKDDGLLESLKKNKNGFSKIPTFTVEGKMGSRQCTYDYKILPIKRKVRELLGYAPRKRIPAGAATMWIGISTDEAIRMKPSRDAWIVNRWPLIELGMSRHACLGWFDSIEAPKPPKSSCLGCPYHSDKQWIEIKNGDPKEWLQTVEIDNQLRNARNMKKQEFLHRSLLPLDQVNFSGLENQTDMLDGFGNECEGMCGV